jgi:putative membrane protein
MNYDLFRALHILSVIAWMAGLLYLPRLFIYHIQNQDKPEVTSVFRVMERKLIKLIMNPAMIAAWIFGCGLIYIDYKARGPGFLTQAWFLTKIAGIIAITGWHHYLTVKFKKLDRGEDIGSEKYWRIVNEVPFVIAIIMVLAVTLEFGA